MLLKQIIDASLLDQRLRADATRNDAIEYVAIPERYTMERSTVGEFPVTAADSNEVQPYQCFQGNGACPGEPRPRLQRERAEPSMSFLKGYFFNQPGG